MEIILYSIVFGPFLAALVSFLIGKRSKELRDFFVVVFTGFELALLILLYFRDVSINTAVVTGISGVMDMGLRFSVDAFRVLYGILAAVMWFVSAVSSKEYFAHYRNRNRYYLFFLLTLGATEGVLLSADLFTTFLFFEIMSFTSYVWVAQDEKEETLRAAATYLAVAVIGGLVMLMGIFLMYNVAWSSGYFQEGAPVLYTQLKGFYQALQGQDKTYVRIAGVCILFGFGAKAGAFPLHIWLPKAHPVAPAPASALLSGILTKTGVYGILMLTAYVFLDDSTWGGILLVIGVITMVLGAVLALFSVDLKRTLACSSVSQIGFILVGVGMSGLLMDEKLLAVRGSLLHMVNHSLIKLVLFLAAGVIFQNIHALNLNTIRGFGRKKPLLTYIFALGALGIGGMPGFNGYVSKTLLHESIVEYTHLIEEGHLVGFFTEGTMKAFEWLFLLSGGFTVAYMMKLFIAIFIEKNADKKLQKKYDGMCGKYVKPFPAALLTICATFLFAMGVMPTRLTGGIADRLQVFWNFGLTVTGQETETLASQITMHWFSAENLKGAAISIGIGLLLYFGVVRTWMMKGKDRAYVNRWQSFFDLENLVYRPILLKALPFAGIFCCRILDSLVDGFVVMLRKTLYKDSPIPQELEEGTRLTKFMGELFNKIRKKRKKVMEDSVDYVHLMAQKHEQITEERILVARSMSFGLLLFCIGLVIAVAYILIR